LKHLILVKKRAAHNPNCTGRISHRSSEPEYIGKTRHSVGQGGHMERSCGHGEMNCLA